MTRNELRVELKKHGLKVHGSKAELQERLDLYLEDVIDLQESDIVYIDPRLCQSCFGFTCLGILYATTKGLMCKTCFEKHVSNMDFMRLINA